jgi:8-hydroxy-5-deazaflavin:NADPH oxidoreductase
MSDASDSTASPSTIGFIGGTGPQGRGLGLRLAQTGHRVLLGSRDAAKAEEAVAKVAEKVAGLPVEGMTNAEVCAQADVLVVVVPYAAQRPTLTDLAGAIGDRVVVCCVNSLGFDEGGPHAVPVPDGSAAEECAALLPDARVVGAWQNVSAVRLNRPDEPVECDVLLTGDDEGARDVVAGLVEEIPGMRAVHAGALRLSRPVEELTAVLIGVNKRYKTHAGVRIAGLG